VCEPADVWRLRENDRLFLFVSPLQINIFITFYLFGQLMNSEVRAYTFLSLVIMCSVFTRHLASALAIVPPLRA
jgi:hypothetical protein